MTLRDKSLTQLRGIAQSFGVQDIFSKTDIQLIQAIELKQKKLLPEKQTETPKPEYDARLMTKPPSKKSSKDEAFELLQPFIERGMKFTWDDEHWHMQHGKREDTGSVRIPLRILLKCAEKIMA